MTVKKEQLEKRLTFTLKKPHTHKGIEYTQMDIEDGAEIEVSEEQARFLKDQGIIEE